MNHRSAIVTGGAGFVGSHLCESLLADGVDVVCVDNFGSGRERNVTHLREDDSFTVLEADVRKRREYPDADVVYHLASRASPEDFTDFPVRIALTNTEGTRNLLEYARRQDASMVYASTSEVYGDPEVHPQPESYNGNVNIRGPRGCYDESKRFGETLAVAYEKEYDIDVRTARIFNTYGPRMRPDDGRVIPTFLSQVADDEDLTVHGDGSQTRSFCYVDDLVRGLRRLGEYDDLQGEVINLGSQNEITIRTLAEEIIDLFGTGSGVVYEPLPEDDPQQRRPDTAKAERLLDWSPTVGLREGLERTMAYYRG